MSIYESITFYWEWLQLPKAQFYLLMMIADKGNYFCGNLSDICRYQNISTNNNSNKQRIKAAINDLILKGFLICSIKGYTYNMQIIPKEKAVAISRRWIDPILKTENFSMSVSKVALVKTLIWISEANPNIIVTNQEISIDLDISISTVIDAKNVLKNDFHAITQEVLTHTLPNGEKRNVGQLLGIPADWSE